MRDKRSTIETTRDGYLECLAHGARSGYVRTAIDARLDDVREALAILRERRGKDEVLSLVEAASLPIARIGETDIPSLSPMQQDALSLLWAEGELTGLGPRELLAALERKVGA